MTKVPTNHCEICNKKLDNHALATTKVKNKGLCQECIVIINQAIFSYPALKPEQRIK